MLTGNLVRLRAIELDDLDRYLAWLNDPEVTQYLGFQADYPLSRAQEEEWIRGAVKRTQPPDISYAIEALADRRHIGSIGLHGMANNARKAELGIMIGDKSCWNNGYGTDALQTMLRFAFGHINLNRVSLQVYDFNARAIACYRKCGFVEEGRLRRDRFRNGEYGDTLVMAVLRDEFRALSSDATTHDSDPSPSQREGWCEGVSSKLPLHG